MSGETQQIDRILFVFSERYWDCNPDFAEIYRSTGYNFLEYLIVDIVYATVFSLVLLNTDLHVANATFGTTYRRMGKDDYIKNTMTLIEQMVDNDLKNTVSRFTPVIDERKWRKNLQHLLKSLYIKVKAHQIDIPVPKQITKSNSHVISEDSLSKKSPLAVSIPNYSHILSEESVNKMRVVSSPYTDAFIRARAILKGSMNRKHLTDKDGVRAKNRKWLFFNSIFNLNDDGTLELIMSREKGGEDLDLSIEKVLLSDPNINLKSELKVY